MSRNLRKVVIVGMVMLFLGRHFIFGVEEEYMPSEKETGSVKNSGMGWVVYCDAFGQMTQEDYPDYDKGVFNPDLFWQTLDNCGATQKASLFYLRAPWSFYEPTEGEYAWDNPASNYSKLVQGAMDRNLRLAFRVYIDSKDSYQQATPEYVKVAGARGYQSTFWTPYANDKVFLTKFKQFISAFGNQYNQSELVDFIDAMGLGAWGEGHGIRYDIFQRGANLEYVLDVITGAYEEAFPEVLLGGQQGGSMGEYAEKAVVTNKFGILRRDSVGMAKYFKDEDKQYYVDMVTGRGVPLFAENGWNYFAHDFQGYMNSNGNPFSDIRSLLAYSLNDAKVARANTFDLRVPEDAIEWMKNEDLVDDFLVNGGYRLVPTFFSFPNQINSNQYIKLKSRWKNTGLGRVPNSQPGWKYKYKVAFALLEESTDEIRHIYTTDINPADWLKGQLYEYESFISLGNIPDGTYRWAYAIVDTGRNNMPSLELAVDEMKTSNGWYVMGRINVSEISHLPALEPLESYHFREDFSQSQGDKQWYYLQENNGQYIEMQWNQSKRQWQGQGEWNSINGFGLIHPDEQKTVIGWKAPKTGKILIKGNPRKMDMSGGDGVDVRVEKNSQPFWPVSGWQFIGPADGKGVEYELRRSISKGEMIYFVVDKKGSTYYDGVLWNPSINYLPESEENDLELVNKSFLAMASSTFVTADGDIANTIDGNIEEAWGTITGISFPGYVMVDFGDNLVEVNKLTLVTHYGKGQGITNFDVEYYAENQWKILSSNQEIVWQLNTDVEEFRTVSLSPVLTNKIRLKINHSNLQWDKLALNELQVWCRP